MPEPNIQRVSDQPAGTLFAGAELAADLTEDELPDRRGALTTRPEQSFHAVDNHHLVDVVVFAHSQQGQEFVGVASIAVWWAWPRAASASAVALCSTVCPMT